MNDCRCRMKNITEVTRRDIFDLINYGYTYTEWIPTPHPDFANFSRAEDYTAKIRYWGRLDNELEFLKRIYNLAGLPSYDSRFDDAEGDIWQHTINNDDYEFGWVFSDERFRLGNGNEDKYLLNFLCEMFHPAVRVETGDWKKILERANELLFPDGYCLCQNGSISGRATYGWKCINFGERIISGQIKDIREAFNSEYVDTQVSLMYELIETAPHSAIGKAKELLEICCKTILDEQKIPYATDLDLVQLMKLACDSIGLNAKKIKSGTKGQEIAAKILGNLTAIAHGMAELRSLYGDGHGKTRAFQPLPSRYAHLAVGSSVAAVHFMWDTYQERIRERM